MKRYEITVGDGGYPLTRVCDSISEAYGCIVETRRWVPFVRDISLDDMMSILADMRSGKETGIFEERWSIAVREVEE